MTTRDRTARTGQLTKILNNLDHNKDRGYSYDALGRLKQATGGPSGSLWTQAYSYDRYGNRTSVAASGNAGGQPVPRDGFAALAYTATTNRITTAGWQYDAAGNQVRAQTTSGVWQRFQYDAANRLVKVKADDNVIVIASYTYGDDNQRLIADEGGVRTYYAANSGTVICEYAETGSSTTPIWSKSYVYFGGRLLSTLTPNGSGGEAVNYHHPDRLGTRLVTNPSAGTSFEQATLPFGTALDAESTGATNRRFTTYDRSTTISLDYAVNRHYGPQQGRFTQTDPIGVSATNIRDPQSFNSYGYTKNDPVDLTDPTGLMCIQFHFTNTATGEGFWTAWYCTPGTTNFEPKVKPQNSSERRLTKEEYLAIRSRIEAALKSKACRDFIDRLVTYAQGLQNPPGGQYESAQDFLAFSDHIYNSADGGMFWRARGGGQVGNKFWISSGTRPDLNVRADTGTLMHLLIHGLQGRHGSDDTLDVAVRTLGIVPIDKDGKPLPFPDGSTDHDWSRYWDAALQNSCFEKDIR